MGSLKDRMVKLPNAEAWVDKMCVVAVARAADSTVASAGDDGTAQKITMVNFSLRMIDNKTISVQCPDRKQMSDFLNSIGVTWE